MRKPTLTTHDWQVGNSLIGKSRVLLIAMVVIVNACGGGGGGGGSSNGSVIGGSTDGVLIVSVTDGGKVSSAGGVTPITNCDNASLCSGVFNTGSVTLNATPDSGYTFTGWSGACNGTSSSCTFAKTTSTQNVTATFTFSTPPAALGSPIQLYTDITSGPTTGGENGKGIYLSVFGKNFGTLGMGTTVKMYINNIEVDNYRYLGVSRGRTDIQQLTAQIGSLGGAVTNGTAYSVKIVVGGQIASNPNNLTFMPNPGNIYFVSLSGSDTTGAVGNISLPYRTVQKPTTSSNGSSTNACVGAGIESVSAAGVFGQVVAGDFIVMRGGTWTNIGRESFFLRNNSKSGKNPNGSVGSGPITVMGYPTETPYIFRNNTVGSNQGGGGISSADSARQSDGCGAWVTLTNLKIESGMNEGPITTQAGHLNPTGSHWRVINNEMSAISCQVNTVCKGGGVSGSGAGNTYLGNYVHDMNDKPDGSTDMENHGFYLDGAGSYEIAYNRIENIAGGNGLQTFGSSGTDISNVSFHHNLINGTGKHCLNIGDQSATGFVIYNNVLMNCGRYGLRFNTVDLIGAKFYNNTFFNTGYSTLANDWNLGSGAIDFRNNIVVPNSRSNSYIGGSVDFSGAEGVFTNNVWFGGTGATLGSGTVTVNPLFVSTTDLHLQSGSPAIDVGTSAVSSLVATDYDRAARPQGAGYDIGAYEQ